MTQTVGSGLREPTEQSRVVWLTQIVPRIGSIVRADKPLNGDVCGYLRKRAQFGGGSLLGVRETR
jgi:hypothetical protein